MARTDMPVHDCTAMSVADAAKTLGVSKGLIRLEIARGRRGARRVGRRVIILADDLHSYLARQSRR